MLTDEERVDRIREVYAILAEHRLSFEHAGEDAIDATISDEGTVVLELEDGDEELELDDLDARIEEIAGELGGERDPPDPLDAFVWLIQQRLDEHLILGGDDLDHDECCYLVLEEVAADLDPSRFGLESTGHLTFEDEDGDRFRLELDELEVVLEEL